jgi:acetyl esterase/lipase
MTKFAAIVGSLALLGTSPSAFAAGQPDMQPAAAADLSYGPYPIETVQVCEPDGTNTGARVASLVIHGGAWVSEDKRIPWFSKICGTLAAHGIVAFNINYRLLRMADNSNPWPAQLQDVQLAMRWVRAHAKQYNIDPHHICALGTSAGGNLAALLGVQKAIVPQLKGEDPQNETALYPDQSPQATCVVDVSGPTDLVNLSAPSSKPLAAMASSLVGEEKTLGQALAQISPIGMIDEHSAPMLVIYGTADKAVPPETQSLPFYQALKDKGVPAKLLEYTGHHALGLTAPAEVTRALDAAAGFINDPR